MRKTLLYILFVFAAAPAIAQKENNFWAFDMRAGLDFSSGNPAVVLTSIDVNEGSASVSNINSGKLMFYTDGNNVYNRNHAIMPNGIILSATSRPTYSTTQAAAIASVPGRYGLYYVFSLEQDAGNAHVYYSVVNMRLDNGLGDIIQGKKAIPIEDSLTEKMTLVKGNNCDIWLMLRRRYDFEFRAFHITNAGIDPTPVISNVGFSLPNSYEIGEIIFSNNRKKMAAASSIANVLELYDFDANTGMLSNLIQLNNYGYGVAFSPDDSKLYTAGHGSTAPEIGQYDLSIPTFTAINNSRSVVATLPAGSYPPSSPGLFNIKLANNGKMYYGAGQNVSVINLPNLLGTACQPAYNILSMPAGMSFYLGLPNPPAILQEHSSFSQVKSCGSNSATLQASTTGINYVWDDSITGNSRTVTQSGYYAVTYQVGCTAYIDSFYVQIHSDFPQVVTQASCANIPGAKIVLHNSTTDTATYGYTWKDNSGTVLRNATSNTGDTLSGIYPGTYKVRITTSEGCDSTIIIQLPSLPTPDATFNIGNVTCTGQPITFTNTSGASIYSWTFGDGSGIVHENNPVHTYAAAGDYTVALYVENEHGCKDTGTQNIHVSALNLTLTTSDSIVNKNKSVTLTTGADVNYTIIAWQPVNTFSNQTATSQTVNIDTTIRFTAIGQSDKGCLDTATVVVTTNPELFLPSSFTPNGDGHNDYFRPRAVYGLQPSDISLRIFDRWGKVVWNGEGTNAYTGWDGTYSGQPAEIGTYWYLLQGQLPNGEKILQKGEVLIIR